MFIGGNDSPFLKPDFGELCLSLESYNKMPYSGAYSNNILVGQFYRLVPRCPKPYCQESWCLVRAQSSVHWWYLLFMAIHGRKARNLGDLSYKSTRPYSLCFSKTPMDHCLGGSEFNKNFGRPSSICPPVDTDLPLKFPKRFSSVLLRLHFGHPPVTRTSKLKTTKAFPVFTFQSVISDSPVSQVCILGLCYCWSISVPRPSPTSCLSSWFLASHTVFWPVEHLAQGT